MTEPATTQPQPPPSTSVTPPPPAPAARGNRFAAWVSPVLFELAAVMAVYAVILTGVVLNKVGRSFHPIDWGYALVAWIVAITCAALGREAKRAA